MTTEDMIFRKVTYNKANKQKFVLIPASADISPGDYVLIIKANPVDVYKDAIRVRKGLPSMLEASEEIVADTSSETP